MSDDEARRHLDMLCRYVERFTTWYEAIPVPQDAGGEPSVDKVYRHMPFLMSSWWLSVALEHLQAFRALVERNDVGCLPSLTLLRTAYENLCQAIWVLGPASTDERERRAQLAFLEDIRQESRNAKALADEDLEPELSNQVEEAAGSLDDAIIQIKAELAGRDDAATTGQPQWNVTDIIKSAEGTLESLFTRVGLDEGRKFRACIRLTWRLQSGVHHGRMWPSKSLVEFSEPDEESGLISRSVPLVVVSAFATPLLYTLPEACGYYEERIGGERRSGLVSWWSQLYGLRDDASV